MNENSNVTGYVGSSITILTGVVGLEHGLNIFLLVLGIVSGILAITKTIVSWYKESKKNDGVITKDEIKDLGDRVTPDFKELHETIEEVKDEINRTTKK